jgi:predicted aldo/keto reductase-like oxidoreductase
MQYRRLGRTNLHVSAIGFGGIKLPDVSYEQAAEALNAALDAGINFIDTARAYRDSEDKIGRALGHRRAEFYLATKTLSRDAAGALADLETTLAQLRTEYVDLWQLHSVSTRAEWQTVTSSGGAVEAGQKAIREGKVRHFGITIHRELRVMREAIQSGLFDTIMLAYSVLDQEGVEAEILPLARQHDLGVIIMKPLSGGQLVRPAEQRRPGLGGADAIIAGSLRYCLSNPNVSCVIPGMISAQQVRENAAIADPFTPLTNEEASELRRQIAAMGRDFRYGQLCLRCGYCLPCPAEINIPEVMRAMDMKTGYPDELRYLGDELFASLPVKPDACLDCGQCEERCVAGLPIRERLRNSLTIFAP